MKENWQEMAHDKGYFKALNQLYKTLPSGLCKGCTDCCSESVNISYVEGLNILDYINQHKLLDNPQLTYRLLSFELLAYVKTQKCPFLEAGRCMIYEVRPLPCRIFGNRTRQAYAANYEDIRKQNREIALYYYREKKLIMPKRVWQRDIGYCEDYQRTRTLNADEVADLYNQLLHIDSRFYFETDEGFEPLNRDLVNEVVSELLKSDFEWLNQDKLSEMRTDILADYNKELNKE